MDRYKFLKLLNLLADNREKLNVISEIKKSKELMVIYQELPSGENSNDSNSDYSHVTDYCLKKEIINHPKISIKDLWQVFKKEKNQQLKEQSFQNYCQKYPLVLCPRLFSKIIKYRNLLNNKKTLNYFFISWFFFSLITVTSLLLSNLLVMPIAFFAVNLLWFASQGFSNQIFLNSLENFLMGTIVIALVPILIPLIIVGLSLFGIYTFGEESFYKMLKISHKKLEDEDHFYDKMNPWH